MLTRGAFTNLVSRTCSVSIAPLIFVIVPHATLIGCSGEIESGPLPSTLSRPADSTAVHQLDQAAGSTEAHQAGQLPLTSQSIHATTDFTSDPVSVPSFTDGPPPGSDSAEDDPMITVTSTPKGVTVRLDWERPFDADTVGYYIYYGKQPAQESGSCTDYEANQVVGAPPATIAGLEHDMTYYFAVKSFNDSEDACSEEITVVTPPAHS